MLLFIVPVTDRFLLQLAAVAAILLLAVHVLPPAPAEVHQETYPHGWRY